MNLSRKIFATLLLLGFYANLNAQDYTVKPKTQRINDTKYEGYSVLVKGSIESVTDRMYAYLKEKSKVRRKRNYYSITDFTMKKISLDSTIIYLKMDNKEPNTLVWLGIKTFGLAEERTSKIEDALKKELVLMARSYYVHEQELKIQEAENAAQVVSKKQQTLIDQKTNLTTKLEEAEARKIELDNWLAENDLTIKSLNQQLIDNKFSQDSTYLDLQKINKVINMQKQKLKDID